MHPIHAKSMQSELRRICHGHRSAVKCIRAFYHSADCTDTDTRGTLHVPCVHTATTNIPSQSQTTNETSIIIFQCVAASRHVDGDFTYCLQRWDFSSSSFVTRLCDRDAVIVQLFSNFSFRKQSGCEISQSRVSGMRSRCMYMCVCERARIMRRLDPWMRHEANYFDARQHR